jgi:DNA repair exonuclease SbcCD ATPase subunit
MAKEEVTPVLPATKEDVRLLQRSLGGVSTYLATFFKEFISRTNETKNVALDIKGQIKEFKADREEIKKQSEKTQKKLEGIDKKLEEKKEKTEKKDTKEKTEKKEPVDKKDDVVNLKDSVESLKQEIDKLNDSKIGEIQKFLTESTKGGTDLSMVEKDRADILNRVTESLREVSSQTFDRISDTLNIQQVKDNQLADRNLNADRKSDKLMSQEMENIASTDQREQREGFEAVLERIHGWAKAENKFNKKLDDLSSGIWDYVKWMGLGFGSGALFWGWLASKGFYKQHFDLLFKGTAFIWNSLGKGTLIKDIWAGFTKTGSFKILNTLSTPIKWMYDFFKGPNLMATVASYFNKIPKIQTLISLPSKIIPFLDEVFGLVGALASHTKYVFTTFIKSFDIVKKITAIASEKGVLGWLFTKIAGITGWFAQGGIFAKGFGMATKFAKFLAPAIAIFKGVMKIFENWEERGLLSIVDGIGEGLKSFVMETVGNIPALIGDLLALVLGDNNFIVKFLRNISATISTGLDYILKPFITEFENMFGGIKKIFKGDIMGGLYDIFLKSKVDMLIAAKDTIVGFGTMFKDWAKDTWPFSLVWGDDVESEETKNKEVLDEVKKLQEKAQESAGMTDKLFKEGNFDALAEHIAVLRDASVAITQKEMDASNAVVDIKNKLGAVEDTKSGEYIELQERLKLAEERRDALKAEHDKILQYDIVNKINEVGATGKLNNKDEIINTLKEIQQKENEKLTKKIEEGSTQGAVVTPAPVVSSSVVPVAPVTPAPVPPAISTDLGVAYANALTGFQNLRDKQAAFDREVAEFEAELQQEKTSKLSADVNKSVDDKLKQIQPSISKPDVVASKPIIPTIKSPMNSIIDAKMSEGVTPRTIENRNTRDRMMLELAEKDYNKKDLTKETEDALTAKKLENMDKMAKFSDKEALDSDLFSYLEAQNKLLSKHLEMLESGEFKGQVTVAPPRVEPELPFSERNMNNQPISKVPKPITLSQFEVDTYNRYNSIKDLENNEVGKQVQSFERILSMVTEDYPELQKRLNGADSNVDGKTKIPQFAEGAVVLSEVLARVGEAGKEVVMPLDSPVGQQYAGFIAQNILSAMRVNSNISLDKNNSPMISARDSYAPVEVQEQPNTQTPKLSKVDAVTDQYKYPTMEEIEQSLGSKEKNADSEGLVLNDIGLMLKVISGQINSGFAQLGGLSRGVNNMASRGSNRTTLSNTNTRNDISVFEVGK